jgi:LysM repeat protein
MMKRLLILFYCLPLFALAQDKPIIVEGTSPDLYINHTVGPKENYYSIGRIYNISPREYAPYNKLTMDKGLSPGQVIKIPLTAGNFTQTGEVTADEVLVPVYHPVKDKEGLFRISTDYNKLPVATIKKWNNISGDAVSNGTNLIIGYLKVRKELSPLAAKAVPAPMPAKEEEQTAKEVVKPAVPVQVTPAKTKKETAVVTEPEKKEEQIRPEVKPEIKEEVVSDTKSTEGFFKNDYSKEIHDRGTMKENGAAAIFKSTSGWEDGKYYCLYNTAPAGSIVKITNNTTSKSVYAKVLDIVPDIKQNNGLLIRLSNAAASQLGVNDENKFDCTVEYSK